MMRPRTASSSGERDTAVYGPVIIGAERLALRVSGRRVLLGIRVRPEAPATRPVGVYGDRLKVQVAAPADAGRANDELVRAVADWVGVPADRVTVEMGRTNRDKVLAIEGIDETAVRQRLELILGDSGRGRVR